MKYKTIRETLDSFYKNELPKTAESICKRVFETLDKYDTENPGLNQYQLKAMQYDVIADTFEPILFDELPFYYETGALTAYSDGNYRRGGAISANGWLILRNMHMFEENDPDRFKKYNNDKASIFYDQCGPYADLIHFGIPMEKVFKGGLKTVFDELQTAKDQKLSDEERDFFEAAERGIIALKKIADKFASAALKKGMTKIADIASRVPWNAPKTFHEGLCTLAFMRKCLGALEGIGFSSFGRVDVLLKELYENDVKNDVNEAEMYDLVCRFLLIWDSALDRNKQVENGVDYEYENTLTLGGCDDEGNHVWNDVTKLFLDAQYELNIIYPKIMCRYSANSPTEYLEAIGKSTLAGKSLILYENDDCMIPALVRSGVELRDARRYIVGGCWDAITPECSKKFSGEFVNIMRSLELAIHQPEKPLCEDGLTFESLDDIVSFEEFYNAYLRGVEKVVRSKAEKTAEGSRLWHKASPNCIVSALMEPCIPNKLDITAGGGKYNWECNYFSGFPDTVDSLLAVKELCFDKKICTLKDLLDACRNNWPDEQLRRKAIAAPSYGDGTAEAAEMSSKLHDDLYRITRGLPTVYGGEYSIGYNMFNQIIWWGRKMKATPNGRKHGDYLAHGLTPSRLQGNQTITDTLNAIKSIDTEKCSGNSVVNLVLPAKNMNSELFAAFMRSAAESGVQAMQINCVNREELLEAQKDPENHKHIIVRICGFSAPFVSLSPIFQEEFLKRNFY